MKLLFSLLLAGMWPVAAGAQQLLVIESPASGQKFTGGHAVLAVKVDASIKRVKAAVTQAESDAKKEAKTVFSLGPIELGRGVDHWSPDVSLAKGKNTITVSDADNENTKATMTVTAEGSDETSDTREDFQGTFYAGATIDSFASNETKQYIGHTSADSGPKTGYAAGVNFEYRIFKHNTESRAPLQLWLFGETVHGQRSAEVDCSQSNGGGSTSPLCGGFNPDTAPQAFLAVLRNASSLEGYAGARLEFLKLNRSSKHSANLYVKSQLGFMTVQNTGSDVTDSHTKFALGAMMTNGPFSGSYFDAGWGRTDLFAFHRGRRFKVDGYIQWETKIKELRVYPFFQLVVDSDFGRGSDDLRSYYGINVDIKSLSCLFNPGGCASKSGDSTGK